MKLIEINPYGASKVKLKFACKECHNLIESDEIYIPSPNLDADTAIESQRERDCIVICAECKRQYEIDLFVNYAFGEIHIEGLDDDDNVEVIETEFNGELAAILSNTAFHETYSTEISKIRQLNNTVIENEELIEPLRRLLFISAITCLESYLSSAFIVTTMSNQKYLKNFFETFEDFKNKKISYSELYKIKDNIEYIAKSAMINVVYHNLSKVSSMFENTLEIKFPPFEDISDDILVRHDLVHRNGLTKDGLIIVFDKDDIEELINRLDEFVWQIDKQIEALLLLDNAKS